MYDSIIIGAGPAGLTAASTCAGHGMKVLVIDEYMKAGGRLLGQLYEEPGGGWWNGIEESQKLFADAVNHGAEVMLSTPVNDIENNDDLWTVYTEKGTFQTKKLLLATGAAESPVAVPGWTLPGVMSVGAAQVMTNVHRVKPGNRGIIIGVNVLSAAIAMELKMADVEVAGLTLPEKNMITKDAGDPKAVIKSLLHVSHMAPSMFVKYGSKLMKNNFMQNMGVKFYPKDGVKMWGIPIQLRKAVTEIYGDGQVEGVKLASINADGRVIPGSEKRVALDFVCIAGGLYPLTELAGVAGCPFYLVEELGGYIPLHNDNMETPLPGLYVAGNITGIEGAKVAAAQGRTAGLSMAGDFTGKDIEKEIQESVSETANIRANAYIQFHPDINAGREKLKEQWKQYQLTNE
ncbi:Hydrogen cyanide synthase subunit HcnB [Jeotgalicoccus saudimassiliensis]|uniref:Hydrogen cyanide synthase subunit HcnB n=1 Tax=Jeotgalicoccus saudimassiliensis TaxID=1461582 RepID=A0A078M794_9STAP|nr:NAD(P)/FAD-dependent oxidoreductase [Jeotgalicoccus saudimassiliensis]CEA02144.1 Hydrogen cyanide synthase subunit HcnB [Jeotgalicoccus saudimassiliensis]